MSPVTLLPSTSQPIAISRGGSDLPSRLAEDLFWLGRYAERTDSQARLARGAIARMIDQTGFESAHAVQTLASACRPKPLLSDGVELEREFIDAMLGEEKDEDLRGTVANVHRLARVLRDTISTDSWRILQELYRTLSGFKIGQTVDVRGSAGTARQSDRDDCRFRRAGLGFDDARAGVEISGHGPAHRARGVCFAIS